MCKVLWTKSCQTTQCQTDLETILEDLGGKGSHVIFPSLTCSFPGDRYLFAHRFSTQNGDTELNLNTRASTSKVTLKSQPYLTQCFLEQEFIRTVHKRLHGCQLAMERTHAL